MLVCPHCNKPSIRIWAKYWASTADPAVCEDCDKPSSIPGFLETASTLLYAIAVLVALNVFAIGVAKHRAGTLTDDYPAPAELLIGLIVFYLAVEAAKVYWVPLKALSDHEVERRKSTYGRLTTIFVIILVATFLLGKCGF